MNDARVWIRERKRRAGGTSYHLRWISPVDHKWKSRAAGPDGTRCTDRKRAVKEQAKLEDELNRGLYRELRKATWQEFADDHVGKIIGELHRREAKRVLDQFAALENPAGPTAVSFAMVESFREKLRAKGNAIPTVNKACRYVHGALRRGIDRGYLATDPMKGWQWDRENENEIRIATPAEEAALLAKARELSKPRWESLILVALNTGGRCSELLGLTWADVDFGQPETAEGASIVFRQTKGKRDRRLPISPDLVAKLRRLQAQTLQAGGPFRGMHNHIRRSWCRLCRKAGVSGLTLHDLRRTFATRLIQANVPLPTVQRLCGHTNIKTTLKYYNRVSEADLREATGRLWKVAAG